MGKIKALAISVLVLGSCSDRSTVGVNSSAEVDSGVDFSQSDTRVLPDKGPVADKGRKDALADAASCAPPLAWGFVTSFPPGNETVERKGVVTSHGTITEPLATNPAFKHEIKLEETGTGELLVLQYYLPDDRKLPLDEGSTYTVTVRRKWMFEGPAEGLVIERQSPGPFSLVFAGDLGYGGRAIDFDDPQIAPLTIDKVAAGEDCPVSNACGSAYVDKLRFVATTGAGISEALLAQGASGSVSIMGMTFTVINIRSYYVSDPCPDEIDQYASWVAIIE